MDRADLVAHGVADHAVVRVEHHKDLVHAEQLGGRGPSHGLLLRAALEKDMLTPLVASVVDGTVGRGDCVVAVGGGSDHWAEEKQKKKFQRKYDLLSGSDQCDVSLSSRFLS